MQLARSRQRPDSPEPRSKTGRPAGAYRQHTPAPVHSLPMLSINPTGAPASPARYRLTMRRIAEACKGRHSHLPEDAETPSDVRDFYAWLTFFMGDIRFPSRSAPLQHDTHSYSTGRGTIRYSTAGDPCAILMASCQDDWFDRSAPRTCVSWFAYGVGGGEVQAGQSCTGWLRNLVGTAAIANVELSQLALPRPINTMLSALCLFFLLLAMSPTGACGVRTGCFMFSLRILYSMRSVLMERARGNARPGG